MSSNPDLTRILPSERRKVIEAVYGPWTGPEVRECWCGCGKKFKAKTWWAIYFKNHRTRDFYRRRQRAYQAQV